MKVLAIFISLFPFYTFSAVEWLTPVHHKFKRSVSEKAIQYTFKFKNVGTSPVILVKSPDDSKECRIKYLTKEPVVPQKIGMVTVTCTFKSAVAEAFRHGSVLVSIIDREVTLSQVLAMSGYVLAKGEETLPNTCEVAKDCKVARGLRLCFYNNATYNSVLKLSLDEDCFGMDRYGVDSINEIQRVLNNLKKGCDTIKELKFSGHGSNQGMDVGYDVFSINGYYGDFSCLMAKDAEIKLFGCNTGEGCLGRITMYEFAETLLKSKGGKVYGHSTPSLGLSSFGDTSPIGSRRVYSIDQDSEKWSVTGTGLAKNTSLIQSCTNECQDMLNEIKKESNRSCIKYLSENTIPVLEKCSQSGAFIKSSDFIKNTQYLKQTLDVSISDYKNVMTIECDKKNDPASSIKTSEQ
jgi:hypothetical protein